MKAANECVTQFAQKLAARGYRLTHQRLCILEALMNANDHPTVAEIFERMSATCPTTSLGTVYRTLETLKEMGEVIELQFRNGSNRYDGVHRTTHPHVICTRCGRIEDMEIEGLRVMEAQAAENTGYQVHSFHLEFYGLCTHCQ